MITVRGMLLDGLGFTRFVLRRWTEDRCPQIAGGLAFTTLLALVPIFAIIVALLSSLPFFDDVMVQIKVFLLLNLAPEIAGKVITVYMEEFRHNARRLTTVGVAVLAVTAFAVMLTVDRSINAIWRVRRSRPLWVSLIAYMLLLSMGPILIGVSVSITTYLMVELSTGIGKVPPGTDKFLLQVVQIAVSAVAFFLVYRTVPHRSVPWLHALVGGIVAAILFEFAKEGFAVYVRYAPVYSVVYGTFAALPFFLLWIYISWLVVLFGAELAASLDYWRTGEWRNKDHTSARVGDAVAVARRLFEARGTPVSFERLQEEIRMPGDQLEDALHHMIASGMVEQVGRDAYVVPQEPPKPDEAPAKPKPPQPKPRKARPRKSRSGRSSP